jgi:hypothetical protein
VRTLDDLGFYYDGGGTRYINFFWACLTTTNQEKIEHLTKLKCNKIDDVVDIRCWNSDAPKPNHLIIGSLTLIHEIKTIYKRYLIKLSRIMYILVTFFTQNF